METNERKGAGVGRGEAIRRAEARAREAVEGGGVFPERRGPFRRQVILGDPQTTLARFFEILAESGLLGDGGTLREEVRLLCVGDYFDFRFGDGDDPRGDGLAILSWLAAHRREQAILLLGNHDAARVGELAGLTDERFAAAREEAAKLGSVPEEERNRVFAERYPDIPTPGLAGRDFASFTVKQRALVQRLLLAGRLSLATTARLRDGTEVLVTHAGVTFRELEALGLPAEAPAHAIAAALEAHLSRAVERCRGPWLRGEPAALDLSPVSIAGATGQEGGGLLYHRPANPDRPQIRDRAWEWDPARPRRFDPRRLPPGLVQVAGHTPHRRLRRELAGWLADGADAELPGELRTLVVAGGNVRYHPGVVPPPPGAAVLYLVDAEAHGAAPASYRVLEVAELDVGNGVGSPAGPASPG